ncbi:MAG: serine/threonine protein kinase [Chloroflexi bacterium]|nr:serine/threonine protein kinase [Chloroflexota bacterium]
MVSSGQTLKLKQIVTTESSHLACTVEQFLGGGGQGEVYRATLGGKPIALKWYFQHTATPQQRAALDILIKRGAPNDRFLWPIELASAQGVPGFGYLMLLRESGYKSIVDLMKRRVEPTFKALITAGLDLSNSFLQLHAKGLCYRDISFGNVFFHPDAGTILICDNDNVGVDGDGIAGVLGTPRFMAPEIVRGDARPSTQTDLFSLSVLLFYMLMVSHPLEGDKEASIRCFDLPAMNKIYGSDPVFIFDPKNKSNRPVKGIHDNALAYWPIYPQFVRDLFTKAFTDGLHDVRARVRESEWRSALATLRDTIIFCPACQSENFYDPEMLKNNKKPNVCWNCKKEIMLPFHIRIGASIVMLNNDTQLFPHHIDHGRLYDFSMPVARVIRHPTDQKIWGLKNLTNEKWVITALDGSIKDVEPGKSVTLVVGVKVNFGKIEAEVRI